MELRPSRVIHQGDAMLWLKEQGVIQGASMITSLPDFTEFPNKSLMEWKEWFVLAATRVIAACPDEGAAIFYQRDNKNEGVWVEKSYLCQKAAEALGIELVWHKIVCRVPAGNIAFGKPAYSHMLCFSRSIRPALGVSTADVITAPGKSTWARGMGYKACEVACRFVLEQTPTRTIIDPFCGHGTVLAVANEMGLAAVGVELSRKRAERARDLSVARLRP